MKLGHIFCNFWAIFAGTFQFSDSCSERGAQWSFHFAFCKTYVALIGVMTRSVLLLNSKLFAGLCCTINEACVLVDLGRKVFLGTIFCNAL